MLDSSVAQCNKSLLLSTETDMKKGTADVLLNALPQLCETAKPRKFLSL